MEPMTHEELASLPTTTTIEAAARALGLGRTRAYQLARENRFPCKVIRELIPTSFELVTRSV